MAATVVQGLGSFALVQLVSKAAQQLIAEMRIRVQEHVGRLPVAFHDANKTGDLVSRIMNDVEGLRNLVGTGLIELAGGLLTATLAFAVMLRLSPRVTLLTLVALAVFGLVVFRGFRVLRPIFRERGQMYAEVTGRLTESLGGVRVVKGYHAEAREAAVFEGGVRRILDNVFRTLATTSALSLSSTVLLGLVGAGVMYVGASEILAGRMTVGSFFTYTVFLGFLVGPFFQVATIGAQLTEALAGLERTREILRERPEDEDPRRTVDAPGAAGRGGLRGRRLRLSRGRAGAARRLAPGRAGDGDRARRALGSRQVHDHRPRLRLPHADLGPRPRGRGGPRHGASSTRTAATSASCCRRRSSSTARSARTSPSPAPAAGEDEVLEACRIAHVGEFAEGFADGYDTVVGERGVRLSGGQRQRVAIARAILADPRILILDEATSSLDSESEALIQEGLSWLMKGRTTFVIAHRLSTIRRADQILVVEKGQIVERGTHAELYAAGGRYREMYDRQHGLEANLFLAPGEGDAVAEEPCPEAATPAAAGASVRLGLLDP